MPTASAAMPMRPLSSTLIIMWKPRPSGAEQRVRGQRRRRRSAARRPGEARWPILCSLGPPRSPAGRGRPGRCSCRDGRPPCRCGRARRRSRRPARCGSTACRRPAASRRRSRVAVVRMPETSEPASASVMRVGAAALGAQQRAADSAARWASRAVLRQQRADQLDQAALVGDRGVAARQLLHHERIGQRVHAGAAELRPARRCRTGRARPSAA